MVKKSRLLMIIMLSGIAIESNAMAPIQNKQEAEQLAQQMKNFRYRARIYLKCIPGAGKVGLGKCSPEERKAAEKTIFKDGAIMISALVGLGVVIVGAKVYGPTIIEKTLLFLRDREQKSNAQQQKEKEEQEKTKQGKTPEVKTSEEESGAVSGSGVSALIENQPLIQPFAHYLGGQTITVTKPSYKHVILTMPIDNAMEKKITDDHYATRLSELNVSLEQVRTELINKGFNVEINGQTEYVLWEYYPENRYQKWDIKL